MNRGTVAQHCATMLPNVGIAHVLGIISVRANREYIAKNKGGWAR